jgi:hypothetical protein
VTGDDGPNRIAVTGRGTIDGRGGDDVLTSWVLSGEVVVTGGAGADLVSLGPGSADLRDGEPDRLVCGGKPLRTLRVDAEGDVARGCFGLVSILVADVDNPRAAARPGSRVAIRVRCLDPFRACRARLFPQLARRPFRGGGRHLPSLAVRVRPRESRYVRIRLPGRATRGPRYLRFAIRTASPFAGVPPARSRDVVPIRVRRPR